jgi:hypothetical protein
MKTLQVEEPNGQPPEERSDITPSSDTEQNESHKEKEHENDEHRNDKETAPVKKSGERPNEESKESSLDQKYLDTLDLRTLSSLLTSRRIEERELISQLFVLQSSEQETRKDLRDLARYRSYCLNQRERFRVLGRINRLREREEQEVLKRNPEIGIPFMQYLSAKRERGSLFYYLQTEVLTVDKERKMTKRLKELDDRIENARIVLQKYGYADKIDNSTTSNTTKILRNNIQSLNRLFRAIRREIQQTRKSRNYNKILGIRKSLYVIGKEIKMILERKNVMIWNQLASSKGSREGRTVSRSYHRNRPQEPSAKDILQRLELGEEYVF